MDDVRMQCDDGVTEHGSLELALRSRCGAWRPPPQHSLYSPPDFGHGGVVWEFFLVFFLVTIILGLSASNITTQQARMVDSNIFSGRIIASALFMGLLWMELPFG